MARQESEAKGEKHGGRAGNGVMPAYFLSLTIENLRCFGPPQTLDLSDGKGRPARWTIILGDNGVGKTTLLQSLVAFAPFRYEQVSGDNNVLMPRYPFYFDLLLRWEPFRHNYYKSSFRLSGSLFFGGKLTVQNGGRRVSEFSVRDGKNGIELFGTVHKQQEQYEGVTCFAYGAARRMGGASLSETAGDPTGNLFTEDVSLINAEEWLLQADYAASKASPIQGQAKRRRDQIKEVLIKLLPDVEDIRFAQLKKRKPQMKLGIEMKTPYGWVAARDLSLGYRTLIAWMVDFASRLFDKYPNSANPLAEAAVVLVDEIDLHLHPKWQRFLMDYLSNIFPNTQFIATAHSPLVAQAATGANIAVLRRDGDHVVIDNDVEAIRGWRIDQVLTSDLFGLESARPPQLDDLLTERNRILSKGKITQKDKDRLGKLENLIGPLPAGETPGDMKAMDIIRRAAERLKHQ
jgi:hypothetical protein